MLVDQPFIPAGRDLIRLAANAFHYLYVYDRHTEQSLYLGRTKRLANAAQRLVLHGKETRTIQGVAPNASAASFKLRVREGERSRWIIH